MKDITLFISVVTAKPCRIRPIYSIRANFEADENLNSRDIRKTAEQNNLRRIFFTLVNEKYSVVWKAASTSRRN